MCGIAGYLTTRSEGLTRDLSDLSSVSEAMRSRGPDASGIWSSEDKSVGLAHRRLSIIDLSGSARQPFPHSDTGVQLSYNGEIYNYRELRSNLESKGHHFKTESDTEVLLHTYLEYGSRCVEHLRGMFAFAIWDPRDDALFLARDGFGIKPLYYSFDGGSFYFASQVKALRKFSSISSESDPAGLVGFLSLGFVPEPWTCFKNIHQLSAGSTLQIKKGGELVIKSYYSVREIWKEAGEERGVSKEERLEILGGALKDSVRCHLLSDVPIGFFLSAGLDSTSLTAIAHSLGGASINTITLGFEQNKRKEEDEAPLAELVSKHYETSHQTRWITAEDFKAELEHFLSSMDQPSIDGLNTFLVSKIAKESGLTVALSGLGGDELFSGYPSYSHIPKITKLNRLNFLPGFGKLFRVLSSPLIKHFTSPKFAGIFEYGRSLGGAYLLRRGLFMPWELPEVLDVEVVKKGWEEISPIFERPPGMSEAPTHRDIATFEMSLYMRDQLLRVSDWTGMAHSLEIRVPFVDRIILESVAKLSSVERPLRKSDMTQTLAKPLPKELLERRKTPFAVPLKDWLAKTYPALDFTRRGFRGWGKIVLDRYLSS